MNPFDLIPLQFRLAAFAAVLAVCFCAGFIVQGWRKNLEIAQLKTKQAEATTAQYQEGISKMNEASSRINLLAKNANVDVASVGLKLDSLHKEFKNALKPLPSDCVLDDSRMLNAEAAADSVNAALGRISSRSLPVNKSTKNK